jgi:hypothetical protein
LYYSHILMFYYRPKVEMTDVLAIGGPKPWMNSAKQLPLSPSHISAPSPNFDESPESLQSQISNSPSDYYPSFHSSAASSYHKSLHYPSLRFETFQPRKSSEDMLSQYYLTAHGTGSREDLIGIPPRMESQRLPAYPQGVSPFMAARPDFKVALSSDGSTYCESDIDSLDPFDETFATRAADTQCDLVHPVPKSSVNFTASNISFLSGSEGEPSPSSFKIQDSSAEESIFPNQPYQVPSPTQYNTSAPLGHTHNSPLMTSPNHPDAKLSLCDEASTWASWGTGTPSYGWYPNRDLNATTYDSSWQSPTRFHVPWSVQSNPHNRPDGICDPQIPLNGVSNGLPSLPSNHHPNALSSSPPLMYQSCPSNSVPPLGPIEVRSRHYLPTQSVYIASPHNAYSGTDTGSPLQKPLESLSPSSFTPSIAEEGPSPQQTGDGHARIEASMHYSDERNAFLIDCKRRGLSYKDIKRIGGFTEAESTLRGRYRTLTKPKDQRVRKPKWQDKDVSHRSMSTITERSKKLILSLINRSDFFARLSVSTQRHLTPTAL